MVGQRYYLYCDLGRDLERGLDKDDSGWRLSLISPAEWGERAPGRCLGPCWLREDMTWALDAEASLAADAGLRERVAALVQDFLERLDVDGPLEFQLPGYHRELPYYRRLLAAAELRLGQDPQEIVRISRTDGRQASADQSPAHSTEHR